MDIEGLERAVAREARRMRGVRRDIDAEATEAVPRVLGGLCRAARQRRCSPAEVAVERLARLRARCDRGRRSSDKGERAECLRRLLSLLRAMILMSNTRWAERPSVRARRRRR